MIPKDQITAWRANAPWIHDIQVEQDLVMSRALVAMFAVPTIRDQLAFRGGTALHKMYLQPAARYSEDIDLVQINPGPIAPALSAIRSVLDQWLGEPRRFLKEGRVTLVYRFKSEDLPARPMRLKIETNSREHFSELGLFHRPITVDSRWFHGTADVTTYDINELLGTKLRALYQRSKGRDLFDLWHSLQKAAADPGTIIRCFNRYMDEAGLRVTRAQFTANLRHKASAPDFRADVLPMLRPGIAWDFDAALAHVIEQIIDRLACTLDQATAFPTRK